MYLDFEAKIPEVPGKIGRFTKGGTTYVRYVTGRTYHPEKKYNIPNHKTIGKQSFTDQTMMIPNENYLKYFGDVELPELKAGVNRSSCIRIGAFLVIRKILEAYELPAILKKYLGIKDCGLFLDLAAYSIVAENNAAQYYPDYAYNHPLFTAGMHIYSDLGNIEMVEFGHAKDDKNLPVFNYSIAYDTYNREPLFYEQYPGSIVDISQLQFMLEKASGYGYKHVGFILDRGYFSKENIQYMDKCGLQQNGSR